MRRSPALETALHAALPSGGLITRKDLTAAGVSSGALSRALASGRLVRVRRRVYAAAPLPPRPRWLVTEAGLAAGHTLAVRAVLLAWGPSVAATGRTAALMRGWDLLVEPRKHEVAVRHGAGARLGRGSRDVLVRQTRRWQPSDVVPVTGGAPIPVIPADAVVVDALLALPPLQAVVLADSALRAGDVTVEELAAAAGALPGRRQVAHVQRLLGWCDPEAGSVLESVMRYRMHEGGIVGFQTQRVISRRGRHVLRTDFLFEAERVVVEVDGSRWHPDGNHDRGKDNQLVAVGWAVMRFTWSEVVNDHDTVLALVRDALASRVAAAA